jgi:putative photosynthetic complex assembly protein
MPHDHDDFQTEPVRGLPENLPEGEHILWQGQPDWWALTKEALSFWWVAGYFAFLFAWRTVGGAATESWADSATAASFFLVLGAIVCALLLIVGVMQAKSTVYTLTNRRVAMRIGAALTMTLNLPFRKIRQRQSRRPQERHGHHRAGDVAGGGRTSPVLRDDLAPCAAVADEAPRAGAALHPRCCEGREALLGRGRNRRIPTRDRGRAREWADRTARRGGVSAMTDTRHYNKAEQKLVERDKEMVPTILVRAMFLLCVCVLIIVGYARLTDRPLSAMPPSLEEAPVVMERTIRIFGNMDGSAQVIDVDGNLIASFASDEGGFVAGIYRVLERERGAVGLDASEPIRLVRFSDGRIGLRDDYTDFRAELFGFGADNEAVFARLLEE